jgi:hypothetical protein
MKHVTQITLVRRGFSACEPAPADAKSDFMNALWRAWSDFVYQKKNETSL